MQRMHNTTHNEHQHQVGGLLWLAITLGVLALLAAILMAGSGSAGAQGDPTPTPLPERAVEVDGGWSLAASYGAPEQPVTLAGQTEDGYVLANVDGFVIVSEDAQSGELTPVASLSFDGPRGGPLGQSLTAQIDGLIPSFYFEADGLTEKMVMRDGGFAVRTGPTGAIVHVSDEPEQIAPNTTVFGAMLPGAHLALVVPRPGGGSVFQHYGPNGLLQFEIQMVLSVSPDTIDPASVIAMRRGPDGALWVMGPDSRGGGPAIVRIEPGGGGSTNWKIEEGESVYGWSWGVSQGGSVVARGGGPQMVFTPDGGLNIIAVLIGLQAEPQPHVLTMRGDGGQPEITPITGLPEGAELQNASFSGSGEAFLLPYIEQGNLYVARVGPTGELRPWMHDPFGSEAGWGQPQDALVFGPGDGVSHVVMSGGTTMIIGTQGGIRTTITALDEGDTLIPLPEPLAALGQGQSLATLRANGSLAVSLPDGRVQIWQRN